MSKRLIAVLGAALLLLSLAVVSSGQVQTTTVTKVQTTQNPDGTYTIVEYPVGKQTVVTLNPVGLKGDWIQGNDSLLANWILNDRVGSIGVLCGLDFGYGCCLDLAATDNGQRK